MNDFAETAEVEESKEKQERTISDIELLMNYAQEDNIADDLDSQLLATLGTKCVEDYKEDDASRTEWSKRKEKAIKLAQQTVEVKSYPWPNAANVKYPLLTSAAIQFNARAMPAIVDGAEVVKAQVVGYDEDGTKEDRGDRVGKHMSYQLLEQMEEWEEDTDRLLIILPIVGNVFRKTFYCSIKQRNTSRLVLAENLVYNYEAQFATAPRISEVFEMYPQEIIEHQRQGVLLDVDISDDSDKEDEVPEEFIEQHGWYDLDEDGYKEPYIFTVHVETKKVVRIVARYDVEDTTVKYQGETTTISAILESIRQEEMKRAQMMEMYAAEVQEMQQQIPDMVLPPPDFGPLPEFNPSEASIIKIEPVKYYTKYSFIPSMDGSGYDVGFGDLIGPLSETIDTNLNQMLDAGTLANLQGGFIDKGLKVRKGEIKVGPGEYTPIDNTLGGDIRSKVFPWNFKGPNPTMFTLLQFLVSGATELTSVSDIMTGGEGQPNEPYHSFAIRVSEGMKVFSAIYKRIHRSLKQEYKKLYRLNKIYLPEQEYFRVLDTQLAISRSDYNTTDLDIIPVSDPTIATSVQKAAKGRMLLEVGRDNPRFKQYEIYENALRAFGVNDVDTYLLKDNQMPKPAPDPKMIELEGKMEKMSAEGGKLQAQTVEIYANMQESVVQLQQGFEKLDIEKLSQIIELLSKVVTEPENLETFREAISSGDINGTGISQLDRKPDYTEVDAIVEGEEG